MRRRMLVWLPLAALLLVTGLAVAWYLNATNVETPAYEVEAADGAVEIRRYPAMVAAEVRREGDRGTAVRASFGPLAGYIFAKERGGDKIAMTAPVTQTPEKIAMTAPVTQAPATDGAWTVAFIMPSEYRLADLPAPAGDVRLTEWPAHRAAAIRFSGRWTDQNFEAGATELLAWLEMHGHTPAGPPVYAYYNDPFTPAFLRRNEVIVRLAD